MDRVARTALSSFQRVQQFIAQLPVAEATASLGAQVAELDDVVIRLSHGLPQDVVEQLKAGAGALGNALLAYKRRSIPTEKIVPVCPPW